MCWDIEPVTDGHTTIIAPEAVMSCHGVWLALSWHTTVLLCNSKHPHTLQVCESQHPWINHFKVTASEAVNTFESKLVLQQHQPLPLNLWCFHRHALVTCPLLQPRFKDFSAHLAANVLRLFCM
jgi:hypothetical protein